MVVTKLTNGGEEQLGQNYYSVEGMSCPFLRSEIPKV